MNPTPRRLTLLRKHSNLSVLLATLPFHTQKIIEQLLDIGVTYPLMEQAGNCMDAVFQESKILQILANGNVLALDTVTDTALDELEYLLSAVDIEDDEVLGG
jgi:hypothetical protein